MAFMDTDATPLNVDMINLSEIQVSDSTEVDEETEKYQFLILGEVLGIAILTFVFFAMRKSDQRWFQEYFLFYQDVSLK